MSLIAALSLAAGTGAAADLEKLSAAAVEELHRSVLLIDLHNDLPSYTVDGLDIGKRQSKTHTDIARLREGGVDAVFFAAWVSPKYVPRGQAAHRLLEVIDTIRHDIVARNADQMVLALRADDIVAAREQGKIAVLIGIEGGHAIEDSLRVLRAASDLGARYMTLTHVNTNNWVDSEGDLNNPDVKHHGGLTKFGREVIGEMNRLGMMVDISHVSDKAFWDVLETSSAPVVATHSSCRSISRITRNMTDEMIRALAGKGGVVHINFGCEFLSQASADASAYFNPALKQQKGEVPRATLADVVAHINHVVKLAGIGAVGIGSDFDGVSCVPIGLDDVSRFPNLTRALLDAGYSAQDIRKIYGENTLRVMRAVERTAVSVR